MLEALLRLDDHLTLSINGSHAQFLDWFMIWLSEKWVWMPLYGWLTFLIFKHYPTKKALIILFGIGAAIALSDQSTSAVLKPIFERLRPCHEPRLMPFLHLPKGCGGKFGFASSHAANSFCLAAFCFLTMGKKIKPIAFLFLWAFLVSWSRIYLGAHYVGDVLVGALIGMFWAGLVFAIAKPRIMSKT